MHKKNVILFFIGVFLVGCKNFRVTPRSEDTTQTTHASAGSNENYASQATAGVAGDTPNPGPDPHQKKQAELVASIAKLNQAVQADIQNLQAISSHLNLGHGGQSIAQDLIEPLQTLPISTLEEVLQDYEDHNQGLADKVQQADHLGKAWDKNIETNDGKISLCQAKLNLGTERIIRNHIKAKKQANELAQLKALVGE